MAEYRALIDSDERNVLLDSFEIKEVVNGVAIIQVEAYSIDESPLYRPDPNTELIIEEVSGSPVTRRFGGLVSNVHESALQGPPADSIINRVDAGDFSVYAERRYVTTVIPAGTLEAALNVLIAYLTPYGITLDPGQVTGPSLPEITFDQMRVDACFNYLANLTSGFGIPYVWKIDYDKVLSFTQVGSEICPFNLIEGVGTEKGDVEVDVPASSGINTVTLIYGTSVVLPIVQNFVGNGVADTFILDYAIAGPLPFVGATEAVGYAVVDINGFESLGGLTSGLLWTYNPATLEITRVAGPPNNLQAFQVRYDVQFPQVVTVSNLGSPPDPIWEMQVKNTQIHDKTQAIDYATALLDQEQSTLKTVKYTTFEEGARPGQVQTITVPKRALSGSFLITEVVTRQLVPKGEVSSVITAVGGDTFKGSFRDLYRDWLRDDVGNASVQVAGSGGVPSLPLRSVQFNRGGTFGGTEDFIVDEDGSGPDYGIEIRPARVAIGTADETDQVLALYNRTAGIDLAFAVWILDDGSGFMQANSPTGWTLANITGELNLNGEDIRIDPGDPDDDFSTDMDGFTRMDGVALNRLRFTGTTLTPSTTSLISVYIFGGTAACTVSLPALASFLADGSGHGRVWEWKNKGTANLILDADGTETIDGALTLTLTPGQCVRISAWSGTDPMWHVLSALGSVSVSGGLGGLQIGTLSLTDAQIKALPTTPVTLIAAPPSGYRIKVLGASLRGDFSTALYTNINATYAACALHWLGSFTQWATIGVVNDSTYTGATKFTALFGTAGDAVVDLIPYVDTPSDGAASTGLWTLANTKTVASTDNKALAISMDNNGSGNLTGGNAANSLLVSVYYVLEAL